jgi:SEC-C motif-containing protein
MKSMNVKEKCPCGSGKTFGECCAPLLSGAVQAKTAEALMRARYTAYVTVAIDFLMDTLVKPEGVDTTDADIEGTKAWSEQSTWNGLTIVRTEKGGEADSEGVVEFEADYTRHGLRDKYHETANFKKVDGTWLYESGEVLTQTVKREGRKVGRNEPCPCGSGKKYKQCCGR